MTKHADIKLTMQLLLIYLIQFKQIVSSLTNILCITYNNSL